MTTLMRDSVAGHAIRLLTKGRFFKYAEEKDPSLWQRYDVFANTASVPAIPSSAWEHHGHRFQGLTGVRINPEHGEDANVIDWCDKNDSENPQNWPLAKKVFVTFEICLLTFSVYIGSAIYTPGILTVVQDFQVSHVAATLGLTLFVAGYGLGPLLWSPMSEVPYIGRNPVYIFTLAVFVVLQVPTALAGNLGTLLALQFLTGFFGSPALATPSKACLCNWRLGPQCGPVMGPLVGGFAAQAKGRRWTIWELMWLSGFSLLMLLFFLPETSSANILYRRARRLRQLTGRENLKPFTLNFTEPMVFLLNLYIALIYGLLYVWFESFPIVFTEIYHFNLGQLGLAFLGILVGALLTIPYYWWMHRYLEPQFDENGNVPPEARLGPAVVGACFIPICLFWFGWSARPEIHWIMPIIGSGFFAVGAFLLFNPILNYLPDAYPAYAASVLAGNDLFRSAFSAGFPLFATAMYQNLGVGWASSTLAFLSIAFIPIPFVLMKGYGEDMEDLRNKATGLANTLTHLDHVLHITSAVDTVFRRQVADLLDGSKVTMEKLEKLRAKLPTAATQQLAGETVRGLKRKVLYAFEKRTLADITSMIDSLQGNIDTALNILQVHQGARLLDDVATNSALSLDIRDQLAEQQTQLQRLPLYSSSSAQVPRSSRIISVGPFVSRLLVNELIRRRQALRQLELVALPEHLFSRDVLPDANAPMIFDALCDAGIPMNTSMDPRSLHGGDVRPPYGSIFHQWQLDRDLMDRLYDAGFVDVDTLDSAGYSPLMLASFRLPADSLIQRADWLVSKGADITACLPGTSTSAMHVITNRVIRNHQIGRHLSYNHSSGLPDTSKSFILGLEIIDFLRGAFTTGLHDACECPCSREGGCTPLSIAIRALFSPWSASAAAKLPMALPKLLELAPKTLETAETVIRLATFKDLELTHTCCRSFSFWNSGLHILKPFDPHEAERICDEEAEIIEVLNHIVTGFLKQYQGLAISLVQFMQHYWCPRMQEYLRGGVNLDEGCSTQLNDLGITLTPSTRIHSNALCVHRLPKVTEGNEGSSWTLLSRNVTSKVFVTGDYLSMEFNII
ncbi:hypothetical protein Aspvir_003280 [Aspergillus viridinutans]|uniref:Major facilitator superfamily (MFS) profile domain-containing protein n=1 Tax=Aspergillus viridinutans TaxID=75553 RepID=A0A9P3CCE7_ASPVI|nr:uncharacterized protein Aspvir_003280 [Aspergillus viridinutans]GIK07614.1 hypothetical protein Aspvir_003280 [Aspergillus viridinutans]